MNKIVGLLIINDSAPKGGHSPADRSPNSLWGLYPNNAHEWNVNGDGLNFISLRFPIFALDDEWSEFTLRKAYENIADPSTPQWHADFALPMAANSDQNAHTCLRRSNCDPLGGRNVWSSIESKNQIENQSIMFVSNFDGNAFFHDLATAADVAAAGPAVLLGALDVLSHLPIEFEKKLVFALFTGESWGLIGSRSFVKDIDSFECQQPVVDDRCSQPFRSSMSFSQLSLDRISSVIEVSQIAALSPNAPLYIHPSPNGHSNDQIIKALIESALEVCFFS